MTPLRWAQDLLIGNLCQVTTKTWNDLVRWVRSQEIRSLIINGRNAEIWPSADGIQLNINIPVGGGGTAAGTCTALKVNVGDDGNGVIQACVSPGTIFIAAPQATDSLGNDLPDPAPGTPPVYQTTQIQLAVNGNTFDAAGTPICINPFDPDAECLLLKLEFRGGDEGIDPVGNPGGIVPPGEIVELNIISAPFATKPANQQCREATYTENPRALDDPEQNGISYYPLYDARQTNPQVMCGNAQLYHCGGCQWQLFSLPGNTPN